MTLLTRGDYMGEMDTSSLNWNKFSARAVDQGVVNLVYLEFRNKKIPSYVRSMFEKFYHDTLALNLFNIYAIENLEQACKVEQIKVLTLKGASLLDDIYIKAGIRPMSDIDLMIQPLEHERFANLLSRLGYQKSPRLEHLFFKRPCMIDLHTHALNIDRIPSRKYLFPHGMEVIWQKAVPWKPGFEWILKPDDADNILLLSQHLMKHSFTRLIWLMDIFWLLKRFSDHDWLALSERADFLQQEKPLSYVLFLLGLYFDFHPPPGSELAIRLKKLSSLETSILKNTMQGRSTSRIGPLLSLFCIKTIKKRLRFVLENLFLDKEIVGKEFVETFGGRRQRLYQARTLQAAMMVLQHLWRASVTFFHLKK